jgi:hypothetical protein
VNDWKFNNQMFLRSTCWCCFKVICDFCLISSCRFSMVSIWL